MVKKQMLTLVLTKHGKKKRLCLVFHGTLMKKTSAVAMRQRCFRSALVNVMWAVKDFPVWETKEWVIVSFCSNTSERGKLCFHYTKIKYNQYFARLHNPPEGYRYSKFIRINAAMLKDEFRDHEILPKITSLCMKHWTFPFQCKKLSHIKAPHH